MILTKQQMSGLRIEDVEELVKIADHRIDCLIERKGITMVCPMCRLYHGEDFHCPDCPIRIIEGFNCYHGESWYTKYGKANDIGKIELLYIRRGFWRSILEQLKRFKEEVK